MFGYHFDQSRCKGRDNFCNFQILLGIFIENFHYLFKIGYYEDKKYTRQGDS